MKAKTGLLRKRLSTIAGLGLVLAAVAEGGLGRLGLRSARLGTDELVELYYRTFNPGEITGQIKLG